ncbi:MAG: 50S ribosomal protein L9 [Spirochaetota bacterium]
MKVILNTDVTNLGEEGDVCEVKPGYARNFLLPRNLVLLDNRSNRAHIESRRQEIEARKQKKLLEARSTRERIESEPLVFEMPAGENGKLFGSLSSAGISERLEQLGIEVQRRHIDIPEKTIKSVGTYRVGVRLYGDEQAELTVQVQASGGSGKKAAGKQEAATESAPDDRAQAAAEGDA